MSRQVDRPIRAYRKSNLEGQSDGHREKSHWKLHSCESSAAASFWRRNLESGEVTHRPIGASFAQAQTFSWVLLANGFQHSVRDRDKNGINATVDW